MSWSIFRPLKLRWYLSTDPQWGQRWAAECACGTMFRGFLKGERKANEESHFAAMKLTKGLPPCGPTPI